MSKHLKTETVQKGIATFWFVETSKQMAWLADLLGSASLPLQSNFIWITAITAELNTATDSHKAELHSVCISTVADGVLAYSGNLCSSCSPEIHFVLRKVG